MPNSITANYVQSCDLSWPKDPWAILEDLQFIADLIWGRHEGSAHLLDSASTHISFQVCSRHFGSSCFARLSSLFLRNSTSGCSQLSAQTTSRQNLGPERPKILIKREGIQPQVWGGFRGVVEYNRHECEHCSRCCWALPERGSLGSKLGYK